MKLKLPNQYQIKKEKYFMKKLIALLAFSIVSLQSNADVKADIEMLRSLAPAGSDVAQLQTAILQGASEQDALASAQTNYLIRDLTGDGVLDAVVIFEKNPSLQDDNGKACPKEDYETNCRIAYGDRVIQLFRGQANGFTKISENNKIVLRADDGGVFGDPLNGVAVNKKGSVTLSFYGGSNWRWSYTYTFQFRSKDLYLIGFDDYSGFTGDGSFEISSTNFLTGKVIQSHSKGEGQKTYTKTSRVPVKPLVSLSEVNALNE
jgi:hypothetical protein